ncbi:unnamed protein product [[Actinomadura] parvosata subsp. kistnae]|uniref:Uncharacterized protein n=1 Tax=[Actinomadura] parvosata subsp. kistnae TaxID=1909395 RepID=A0A1V0AH35_9ACTN|nr:hypothetical protein [Nonomuraea sp. ATCC 55076]AQZ69503.1 hypothetical protein BKM31_55735 [Nonomuraea sp. ATCC 55076]SPL91832.1 unnamed protein product [Actinomadura parvosata subsp. kistnae]
MALTVGSYAAAVALLTWATLNGLLLDGPLRHALVGDDISVWSYVVFDWPGLIVALVLAMGRARRVVHAASRALTGAVLLSGVVRRRNG